MHRDDDDQRTIEEIYGLDKEDRFDRRSDEEKASDEVNRKRYDEAKKRGDLSGESFGGPLPDRKTQTTVTDIRVSERADGTVEIDNVLAVKGLHDESVVEDPDAPNLPDGIETVIEDQIDYAAMARPWNGNATEDWKTEVTGDEFLMAGTYNTRTGTYVAITPKAYFAAHGAMFDGPLDIGHLLPVDVEEIAPGEYRSMSRDWNHVGFDLARRGFTENWYLQLWLNNQ
jgi:hypothetical protein